MISFEDRCQCWNFFGHVGTDCHTTPFSIVAGFIFLTGGLYSIGCMGWFCDSIYRLAKATKKGKKIPLNPATLTFTLCIVAQVVLMITENAYVFSAWLWDGEMFFERYMKASMTTLLAFTLLPGALCVSMMWIDVAQKAGSLSIPKAKREAQKRRLQCGIGAFSTVCSLMLGGLMMSNQTAAGAGLSVLFTLAISVTFKIGGDKLAAMLAASEHKGDNEPSVAILTWAVNGGSTGDMVVWTASNIALYSTVYLCFVILYVFNSAVAAGPTPSYVGIIGVNGMFATNSRMVFVVHAYIRFGLRKLLDLEWTDVKRTGGGTTTTDVTTSDNQTLDSAPSMDNKVVPEGEPIVAGPRRHCCFQTWGCCCGPRLLQGPPLKKGPHTFACCGCWFVSIVVIAYLCIYQIAVGYAAAEFFEVPWVVCPHAPGDITSNGAILPEIETDDYTPEGLTSEIKVNGVDATPYVIGKGNMLHDWIPEQSAARKGIGKDSNWPRSLEGNYAKAIFTPDGQLFPQQNWTFINESDYTTVNIPARDGNNVNAWYSNTYGTDAPVVILVHGRGMCKSKYEVLLPANMLWKMGFNVMVIDMRNHGNSDPDKDGLIKWGKTEHLDVLGAWDWLQTQGWLPTQIGLLGCSMGGGTTTIATAKEPLVQASWIDAGVCMPDEVLKANIVNTAPFAAGLAGGITADVYKKAQEWTEDSLTDTWPIDMAKKVRSTQNMYFVQTSGDITVDVSNTETCYANAKSAGANAEYHLYDDRADFMTGPDSTVKDGVSKRWLKVQRWNKFDTHVFSMLLYPQDYNDRLGAFFCEHLDIYGVVNCPTAPDDHGDEEGHDHRSLR